MNPKVIQSIVDEVMLQLNKEEQTKQLIPIAASARHAHLSVEHLDALFGPGYELTKKADLSQPGQFAANEVVLIVGPKGSIERVRILGPARGATQVEVSKTDSIKLGLEPPLRESGKINGSSPVTIVGPKGSIHLMEGLIVAQCHIHMNPKDAAYYGVEHGEWVQVKTHGQRPMTFEKVLIRVSERFKLEMHIDTDEANAAFLSAKDTGTLIQLSHVKNVEQKSELSELQISSHGKSMFFEGKLLTERDVLVADVDTMLISRRTIITPLANDKARTKGITILVEGS